MFKSVTLWQIEQILFLTYTILVKYMGLKHKNNVAEGLVCEGGRDQGGRETRE